MFFRRSGDPDPITRQNTEGTNMKVQILGSAAAECFPALWCECEYCAKARKNGEIRRRAAYRVDDDTLIDFGPDIHWQTTEFGIDLTKIRRVILTHPHGDHLSPIEFLWRKHWFSKAKHEIDLYGAPSVFSKILAFCAGDSHLLSMENDLKMRTHAMGHGSTEQADDLTIFAMDADHAPGMQPLLYLLTRGGKTVFIGNDTGWFPPQTWDALAGKKIDLAILDCTNGLNFPDEGRGHMGANVVIRVKKKLEEMGCLKDGARVVATHFSHNGGGSQAEFEAFFDPHGIETGFDGKIMEI